MTTCQVSNESNACVAFYNLWCPFSFIFVKTPEFKEWYSIDTSFFGSKWILTIRGDATARDYMLWNSDGTGNIDTSKIWLDSAPMANVPPVYIFSWALCTISDLISAHWTRSVINPLRKAFKVKDV